MQLISGAPILEIGCGSGMIYDELITHRMATADSYIGGDISQKMLDIAHDHFPLGNFLPMDIFSLPYQARTQPNVICIQVLQHLPTYTEAVKELLQITEQKLYITSWFSTKLKDNIKFGTTEWCGERFYNNVYSLPKFLAFLYEQTKAKTVRIKQLANPSYSISIEP